MTSPLPLALVWDLIAADRASPVFNHVAESANRLAAQMDRATARMETDMRRLEASSTRTANSVHSRLIPSLGGALSALKTLSLGALSAGAVIGGFGLKTSASLEQTKVAFTSLLGSAKAANDELKSLQQFAAKTPFSQQDVFGYAQQYLALANSVGLSQDQLKPFLTTIGNIAAVTGASTENIHNAVLAIAQIGSRGKVTLDNLNQIAQAFPGFNAAAAIASATGQTTAQVMKEIGAGAINAKVGVQALLKGMEQYPGAAGAMVKQSQTLNGLFSTFADTIRIKLTNSFQQLVPVAKRELSQLTPIIGKAVGQLAPVLTQFAKQLAPVIAPLVRGLSTALGAFFQAIGPGLKALAPVIQPLADGFAALARTLTPVITLIGKIAGQLGPPLLDMFRNLLRFLRPVIRAFDQALGPVLPVIAQAFRDIARAMRPIARELGQAFADMITAVAPELPGLAKALADLAVALVPLVKLVAQLVAVFARVQGVINAGAVKALTGLINVITPLVRLIDRGVGAVKELWSWLAGPLSSAAKALKGPLQALADLLSPLAQMAQTISDFTGPLSNVGNVLNYVSGATGTLVYGTEQASASLATLAAQASGAYQTLYTLAAQMAALGAPSGGATTTGSISFLPGGAHPVAPVAPSPPPISTPNLGNFNPKIGGTGGGAGAKKPPFDPSTLKSFLQTVIGTSVNPLVDALNRILQSAAAAGKKLDDSLIKQLRSQNQDLIGLVAKRDQIAKRLDDARQKLRNLLSARSQERQTIAGGFTFDIGSSGTGYNGQQRVTFNNILAQIRQTANRATLFGSLMKKLAKEGLNRGLLAQLAEAGPAAYQQAQALAGVTPKQLDQINRQYSRITTAGRETGSFISDRMYDSGIDAAQGLIKGLRSKENAVTKAIRELAEKMVKELRKALDMHSPSKRLFDEAALAFEGYRLGIASKHAAIQDEVDRVTSLSGSKVGRSGGRQDLVREVVAGVMAELPARFQWDVDKRVLARGTTEGGNLNARRK